MGRNIGGRSYAQRQPAEHDIGGRPVVTMAERQAADDRSAAMALLTQINLDDLIASFQWQDRPLLAAICRRLLRRPARTFARQIVEFDTAVGRDGLVSASRQTLANYVADVRIVGRDRIPAGSFLALANHPGMSDALSLFTALNRPDLLVVALQRPFLQALPHMSRHLSCLSDAPFSHAAAIRRVSAHLRAGGAALSFPAGHIEPDPGLGSGVEASLQSWVQSAGSFVRLAPETAILPVLVGGVVWPRTADTWLARPLRTATEREKLAAALQLLAHLVFRLRPVSVTVQIGRPIYRRDLGTADAEAIHQAVLAEMSDLIHHPPA